MLLVARHALTPANKTAGDKERLRGWLPFPLSKEGMVQANELAECLEDCAGDIASIHSGTHPRHVQTAHEVARALGLIIDPAEEFNDLNTGDLAGEEVTPEIIRQIHDYYDHPEKKIPGGESTSNWMSRYLYRARPLVEDKKDLHLLITSGRSANLLLGSAENGGGSPDMDVLKERPLIDNCGMFLLSPDWKVVYKTGPAKKQAS